MSKEIVVIMGYPASGKTLIAKEYEEKGYHRLNRDEVGGSLDGLIQHLEKEYSNNSKEKFVMDNTYPSIQSRQSIIQWAKNNEFEIYCKLIDIDIGDALFNASKRLIDTYGKLLMPEEIKESKDSGVYPPVVIYKYRKSFEAPTTQEGFTTVEKLKFSRTIDKDIYANKAIILDYDGTLRKTKSGEKYPKNPEDIEILPHRTEKLKEYQEKGYILLGFSNQSFVSKGEITEQEVEKCFQHTNSMLGVDIEYKFCPHPAFPQTCFCRKPLPGMGVYLSKNISLIHRNVLWSGI